MAGLAHAVLVIEAGMRSGTRITARLATEYNRDVLAVPGSIFSIQSQGTNELIRLGATPIVKSEDILQALGFEIDEYETKQRVLNLDDLNKSERIIVQILRIEPLERDDLIRSSGLPVQEANVALASLDIKGILVENMGQVHLA
jgi:DNA processing protein